MKRAKKRFFYRVGKRLFDVVLSLFLTLLFLPLMLIVALSIVIADGGNPFFLHTRVGQGGAPLRVLKFRTMKKDAEALLETLSPAQKEEYEREYKLMDDPRLIGYQKEGGRSLGAFLRRTSLDELPQLEEKERLLSDVVDGLKLKDNNIYEEIFHSSAPNVDPLNSIDLLTGLNTIADDEMVRATEGRLESLKSRAENIEANFMEIARLLSNDTIVVPPMTNPLKKFTFPQTGASTGEKINPFYKVKIKHNGLDMIVPSGEPVYASANGVVSEVTKSRKGLGNVVTIDHGNGHKTRYAHLADIEVRKGRVVKKGTKIGYVGVSGNSFAPHLHYEVLRDTLILDPVSHFFASVGPEEYVNMLIMSSMTGQSMD